MTQEKNLTFETALARLEQIVRSLENGSAPLDESLSIFEEGVKLVKFCTKQLDDAESKIRLLSDTPTGIVEKDFPNGDRNASNT